MTTNTCCGAPARDITIGLAHTTLTFLYCQRCETRRWFSNGAPVELDQVKSDAAMQWNRKLAVA